MRRTSVLCLEHLPGGLAVRVGLPRPSDRAALAELAARTRIALEPGELGDLLRFDPLRRTVLVATVWMGSGVVVGCIAADRGSERRPDLLIADEAMAPGVAGLLCDALAGETDAPELNAA